MLQVSLKFPVLWRDSPNASHRQKQIVVVFLFCLFFWARINVRGVSAFYDLWFLIIKVNSDWTVVVYGHIIKPCWHLAHLKKKKKMFGFLTTVQCKINEDNGLWNYCVTAASVCIMGSFLLNSREDDSGGFFRLFL